MTKDRFKSKIEKLTLPINNQFPRPWTTHLKDPLELDGLIVGMNQATAYTTDMMTHEDFLNYHFGKNGTSYDLYNKVRPQPSPTRLNIENLTNTLGKNILETDVICYSTPRSKHLSDSKHSGGKERGIELFKSVLAYTEPKFLIIYGKKAQSVFKSKIKPNIINTETFEEFVFEDIELSKSQLCDETFGTLKTKVFYIRSIALPEWNKWKSQAPKTFNKIKLCLEENQSW